MSFIASVIIALSIIFSGAPAMTQQPAPAPVSFQDEADALASLAARGLPEDHENVTCEASEARYVDSGEHGTTQQGQFSVWSITNEDVFHHFTCN